jgi:hypothetical protein
VNVYIVLRFWKEAERAKQRLPCTGCVLFATGNFGFEGGGERHLSRYAALGVGKKPPYSP